jgi:hypothetical protein
MPLVIDKPHICEDLDILSTLICDTFNKLYDRKLTWMDRNSSYFGWYTVIMDENKNYILKMFVNDGDDSSTPQYPGVDSSAAIIQYPYGASDKDIKIEDVIKVLDCEELKEKCNICIISSGEVNQEN